MNVVHYCTYTCTVLQNVGDDDMYEYVFHGQKNAPAWKSRRNGNPVWSVPFSVEEIVQVDSEISTID